VPLLGPRELDLHIYVKQALSLPKDVHVTGGVVLKEEFSSLSSRPYTTASIRSRLPRDMLSSDSLLVSD
jgi:hypothetical protein